MTVRIHNIVTHTEVLGPKTRTAIWFQGCNKNCKGCMSKTTRSHTGGMLMTVDELFSKFSCISDIEGITLSGGEVFLQIDALYELLKKVKSETNLGVIIYTGFYLNELKELHNKKVDEIITGLCDLIIDGPYIEELNDGCSLKGSSNQNLNFITDRYREYKSLFESNKRNAEIIVSNDSMFIVGVPDKNTLETFENLSEKLS